jgi:hypothetical protein
MAQPAAAIERSGSPHRSACRRPGRGEAASPRPGRGLGRGPLNGNVSPGRGEEHGVRPGAELRQLARHRAGPKHGGNKAHRRRRRRASTHCGGDSAPVRESRRMHPMRFVKRMSTSRPSEATATCIACSSIAGAAAAHGPTPPSTADSSTSSAEPRSRRQPFVPARRATVGVAHPARAVAGTIANAHSSTTTVRRPVHMPRR